MTLPLRHLHRLIYSAEFSEYAEFLKFLTDSSWKYGKLHLPIFQTHLSQVSFSFLPFKVMMIEQEKKCVIKYVQRRYNKLTTETSDEQYFICNVNVSGVYFEFLFCSLQIFCEKNI